MPYSRSTADDHAAHSVCEAVGEQAGNVVVHDLHLAALELSHLIQADLVLLGVLKGSNNNTVKESSKAKRGNCVEEDRNCVVPS